MKRPLLCIIMFAVMATTAVAQTQQGYVKTRGKLAADGKTVVAGERLSNAIVTIENLSPVKSGANGAFSFALPAGTNHYRLQGAELKGYTLADPDAIRQTHTYSKDLPLIVVLEDMKQREADLEAARKSVRNVMKREIRKKQDELDSLRDVHAITQAKYDSLMRDFWEYRQSSENLVNEMAERYVSTDYDQLDDFNRQVQAYIESGQLTKADSMIRTKGSLLERFKRVKQYEATNAQREVEIQQQQEALDKSRQYTQKEKDDLANDLYRQHLIFLQQPMMQDSALYYLKLRADLDTTNLVAVWEYASLAYVQKNYFATEEYYKMALRNYEKLYADDPKAYRPALAGVQNNLGLLYMDLHDYANSEKYYKLALGNREELYAANPDAYRAVLATTQDNMGVLYYYCRDYTKSEQYYKQALENRERLYAANPEGYRADIAGIQNSLGILYRSLHDYTNSEKYYKLALGNYEKLYAANPDACRADLAATQGNLGMLYRDLHDYASSEYFSNLALENIEKLYAANPDAYRANLASMQNAMGNLYTKLHDYANSKKYYKLALGNYEKLYAIYPEAYRPALGTTQYNLGFLYRDLHDYANSEQYYKLALENTEQLFAANPEAYRAELAETQYNLGLLYSELHYYANSEKYFKQALENTEKLYVGNPEAFREALAMTYWNMMLLYAQPDYSNPELYDACLNKALELYKVLNVSDASSYQHYVIELQNLVALRYLMNGAVDEALAIARENYDLDRSNEITMYYLAQCLNEKAYQYAKSKDYVNAISTIDETISLVPEDANLYDSKGEILLMQGKEQEALKMWKKVLELNPKFLDDYPEGTNLSNGLKAKGLIK